MIEGLDNWINIIFIIILIFTIGVFHISNGKPKLLTILIISWTIVQSLISLSGFYTNTDAFPPRFGLVIIPVVIVLTFSLLPKQRNFILNGLNNAADNDLILISDVDEIPDLKNLDLEKINQK